MKITRTRLRQIIKEEVSSALSEANPSAAEQIPMTKPKTQDYTIPERGGLEGWSKGVSVDGTSSDWFGKSPEFHGLMPGDSVTIPAGGHVKISAMGGGSAPTMIIYADGSDLTFKSGDKVQAIPLFTQTDTDEISWVMHHIEAVSYTHLTLPTTPYV